MTLVRSESGLWLVPGPGSTVESGLPANPRRLFRVLRNGLVKFSFRLVKRVHVFL